MCVAAVGVCRPLGTAVTKSGPAAGRIILSGWLAGLRACQGVAQAHWEALRQLQPASEGTAGVRSQVQAKHPSPAD